LKEASLDAGAPSSVFDLLLKDEDQQQQQLGQNIKRLALPQATSKIVDEIIPLKK
jgi:hypothetical protein